MIDVMDHTGNPTPVNAKDTQVNMMADTDIPTLQNRPDQPFDTTVFDSETMLKGILGCVPDPMIMIDLQLRIVWTNEPARQTFGPDIKHKKCFSALRGKKEPCSNCIVLQTFADGKNRSGEMIHCNADKQERIFHFRSSVAAYGPDNRPSLVMEILHDITAEKKMIRELEQAKTLAESATRAKSEFLSTMSHEIRTPMNAILGMSRLALSSELTPEQHRRIASIQSAGKALLGVINDILDFSRIDAGKLAIRQETFQVGDVMDKIMTVMHFSAREKKIRFYHMFTHPLPFYMTGDAARLTQILIQLVSNALKFTPAGEVAVLTDIHTRKDQTLWLTIRVEDTGIGIAKKKMKTLYEPFTQINSSSARQYDGAGMGLALVKRITDAMNGTIHVQSKLETGTVFTLSVPVIPVSYPGSASRPAGILAGKTCLIAGRYKSETAALKTNLAALGMQPLEPDRVDAAAVPDLLVVDQDLLDRQHPDIIAVLRPGRNGSQERTSAFLVIHEPETAPCSPVHCQNLLGDRVGSLAFIERPILPMNLVHTVTSLMNDADAGASLSLRSQPSDSTLEMLENSLTGKKVLIIDDDPVNREIVGAMVEKTGAAVYAADNGETAVEMIAASGFDLVFTDLEMPRMDGYETTRQIRDLSVPRAAKMPIIALTGHNYPRLRDQCLAAGMNDLLSKPMNMETFSKIIGKWIQPCTSSSAPSPTDVTSSNLPLPEVPSTDAPETGTDLIDMNAGLAYVDNQKTLYSKMLHKFIESYHKADTDIKVSFEAADTQSTRFILHNLTSIGTMIGSESLGNSSRRLLNRMNNEKPTRENQALFEADVTAFCRLLQQVLAEAIDLLSKIETNDPALEQEMTALLASIKKHQPLECRKILARIMAKDISRTDLAQWEAIENLVGRYRFKEAEKKLVLQTAGNIMR